jgi:hypothetical protein
MIKKLLILTLCLIISSCSGFTSGAGLKLKTGDSYVKLGNEVISFEKPTGNCGASVTFFGIVLPVIPVWFTLNSCEKAFDIKVTGIQKLGEDAKIKLKYNGVTYDPVSMEKLTMLYGKKGENQAEYGKKFRFKVENFWKFRMADDKAIIITGKVDGKDFVGELPVKWGIMTYDNWVIPGA